MFVIIVKTSLFMSSTTSASTMHSSVNAYPYPPSTLLSFIYIHSYICSIQSPFAKFGSENGAGHLTFRRGAVFSKPFDVAGDVYGVQCLMVYTPIQTKR